MTTHHPLDPIPTPSTPIFGSQTNYGRRRNVTMRLFGGENVNRVKKIQTWLDQAYSTPTPDSGTYRPIVRGISAVVCSPVAVQALFSRPRPGHSHSHYPAPSLKRSYTPTSPSFRAQRTPPKLTSRSLSVVSPEYHIMALLVSQCFCVLLFVSLLLTFRKILYSLNTQ